MLDIRQKPGMTFRLLSKHKISACDIMSVSFNYCYTDYRAQCSLLCLRKKTKQFFCFFYFFLKKTLENPNKSNKRGPEKRDIYIYTVALASSTVVEHNGESHVHPS